MATPRTGRPRGRPKGKPNKATIEKRSALAAAAAAVVEELTPAQIDALTPRDVMRLAMLAAVRKKDLAAAVAVAKELAPYEHPKMAPMAPDKPPEDAKERAAEISRMAREMRATVGADTAVDAA